MVRFDLTQREADKINCPA